jgi:cell division protein FtsB
MYRLREWLRRESLTLILAVLLIVASVNLALAPHGMRDLLVLRHHRAGLEAEREQQQATQRELHATIVKLQSDDTYLQRIIRKELGFARQNELIYKFSSETSAAASASHP